ncbi:MAG: hypothetical protein MJ138_02140, partial [Kiritimatiellae bacterium]|nr:hypothetical protein [Kiritimatiellia bacterium]
MSDVPENVSKLLQESIVRVRKIYLLRGLAVTIAVGLATTLAAMAVDAFFTLFDDALRWLMTGALFLSLALAAFFSIVAPIRRKLDFPRMARILDGRHPENEERLTTLVEIAARRAAGGSAGCSEALFRVLSREAAAKAELIDPAKEFTSRTIKKRLKWLLAAVAALLLSFVSVPHLAGRLFIRAVAPWVDVGNLYAGDLAVTPGDVVVLKGMVVKIKAEANAGLHATPLIRISRKTAHGWGEEFAERMEGGVYQTTADMAEPEWRYRVSAGPAVSRYYTVRVCELPKYRSFSARLDYPDYAGMPPVVYSNQDVVAISAVEGTRVSFEVVVDEPGAKCDFRIGGRDVRETTLTSNRVTNWSLELVNKDGFAAPKLQYPIRSQLDQPPSVVVERPADRSFKLPPHAKIPLEVSAFDDTCVSSCWLRVSYDGGPREKLRDLSSLTKIGDTAWRAQEEIDLSRLDLTTVQQLAFDVVVEDPFPADRGGPHSATSGAFTVVLEIQARDFGLQNLNDQVDAARKLMDDVRDRLSSAERLACGTRDRIRRERGVSEGAERDVERVAHELNQARKRAEELREAFESDERFRPLAEPVSRLLEGRIRNAVKMLDAAQFAAKNERLEELEKAIPELREALASMKAMDKPLAERADRLRTFEKTRDLADRQRALARAAQEIMAERPVDTRKLEAWKRMEEEASRQARELSAKMPDPGLDDARRKMERAAELMEKLRREIELEKDKNLNAEQKEQRREQLAKEYEQRGDDALAQADNAQNRAIDMLRAAKAKAAEAAPLADRKDRKPQFENAMRQAREYERQAVEAQRQAEDALLKADAPEELMAAQKRAAELRREAQEEPVAQTDRYDAAIEAQQQAREAVKEARADRLEELRDEQDEQQRRRQEQSDDQALANAQRRMEEARRNPNADWQRQQLAAAAQELEKAPEWREQAETVREAVEAARANEDL